MALLCIVLIKIILNKKLQENDIYKSVRNTNKCPICENERKMPTALTVSGYAIII